MSDYFDDLNVFGVTRRDNMTRQGVAELTRLRAENAELRAWEAELRAYILVYGPQGNRKQRGADLNRLEENFKARWKGGQRANKD